MAPANRSEARSIPESRIVRGVAPAAASPAAVARRFRALVDAGAELRPAGKGSPELFLTRRYLPRHEIRLFDATYYLTGYRYGEGLGFFVGYVVLGERDDRPVRRIHPRILYKDSSLVWRVASHFVHDHSEYWIGKGDVRWERHNGAEYLCTVEETTNLPFEIQDALDVASRRDPRRRDDDAVALVLREGPSGRMEPYADFTAPRRRAAERYRIHGGKRVASFTRRGDPSSLAFSCGYEPDFADGVLEEARSKSRFFGGALRKFRILSTNRRIQYYFVASPTHAWANPPQALTTELSTYGVRTHDVRVDDAAFLPAFEYHEVDPTGEAISQIPAGFAGAPHPDDPARADASAWIERLPMIRDFRRIVLHRSR